MVYYKKNRRYGRRKFGYGGMQWKSGAGYGRKKNARGGGLSKLKADVTLLKRSIEYKVADTAATTALAVSSTAIAGSTGPRYICPNFTQGDTVGGRDGNKMLMKSWYCRILLANDRGTPTDNVVRLILFKQTDVHIGANTPNNAAILEDGDNVLSPIRSITKADNFKILADHTFVFDTTQHTQKWAKFYFKLNDGILFNGTTGNEAETQGFRYYLFAISQTAEGSAANAPGLTYYNRFRWCDA